MIKCEACQRDPHQKQQINLKSHFKSYTTVVVFQFYCMELYSSQMCVIKILQAGIRAVDRQASGDPI